MTARRFDIAIVGGGLVGASLACALAREGWRVAMLEAVPLRAAAQPSYDDRTLALSDSSCRILNGLGIWPSLRDKATPIRRIIVRELEGPGRVVLDPAEHGLAAFGHVVEAREFGVAMASLLPGLESLEMLVPAGVTAVEADSDHALVRYAIGGREEELQALLVVGADGAASFVREAAGIGARVHDYGQTAVICNITPAERHEGRAFECFTPSGPLAILPHTGSRCGLVWCLAHEEAHARLEMAEGEFLAAAQARFGNELGAFRRMGRRSGYPLKQVLAEHDTAARTVVLGNAAHAIHPIGAQGFNLGLRDVAALAEVMAEAKRAARDPGDAAVLEEYSGWRRRDQLETAGWTDALARLYARPGRLAGIVRSAGLIAHRLVPSLRRQTAARAMGYRGRIPRLAQGEPLDSGAP